MNSSAEGTPEDDGGVGALLADTDRSVAHLATVRRAVKERWPIPPERRQRILTTLQQIVEVDTFEVEKNETEYGPDGKVSTSRKVGSITMPNHRNQVAAAKVLLAAAKLDQEDQHHVENLAAGKAPGSSVTNVLVLNVPPPRALEAAESPPSP